MPVLSNAKHELFANALAEGKSALDAQVIAGYAKNRGNATTLKQNKLIQKRVADLLERRSEVEAKATEKAATSLAIDREWVMGRLKENAERALQVIPVKDKEGTPTGEFKYEGSVANRALELLGKEIGMFVDRHVNINRTLSEVADAELEAIALGRGAGVAAETPGEEKPDRVH
jgi:hypothetical protein